MASADGDEPGLKERGTADPGIAGADTVEPDTAEPGTAEQDTSDGETEEDAGEQRRWMVMVDPTWQPSEPDEQPPLDAVIGGWLFDDEGNTERFEPNPVYRPATSDSPTDPVDAGIQVVVRGETDGDGLLELMRDAVFGVAVDSDGVAIVAPAPDDVPSLLVTTAPAHRHRCDVSDWIEVGLGDLADALPDQGVDVLFNPGAPASIRLEASVIKGFVMSDSVEE